ncbi:hypothetical protein PLICRDRAFT_233600 [Plicaturopsis crispa FD-325 SS-3]|nr:hypothetical protein PLICRDRAFT_233600 [Plicaturopsis crispa FD-325 SS-3]
MAILALQVEQAVVQEEAPVEKQSAPVDIAPEVPVTILPVNVPTDAPSTHLPLPPATEMEPPVSAEPSHAEPETTVEAAATPDVKASVAAEVAAPADVSATPAPTAEVPSTHTPLPPATDAPPAEKVNGESKTNGTAPIGTPNISQPTTPVAAPLTPTKKQAFPRSESPSSPGSSRFSSIASGRPKRTSSIFGKIKGVFGSPGKKEKEAKEKK